MPGSPYCLPVIQQQKGQYEKHSKNSPLPVICLPLWEHLLLHYYFYLLLYHPLKLGLSSWPQLCQTLLSWKAYCETSFLYALASVYSLTSNILPREMEIQTSTILWVSMWSLRIPVNGFSFIILLMEAVGVIIS